MKIRLNDNTLREVIEIFLFKNGKPVTLPATSENLGDFLSEYSDSYVPKYIVVTTNGNMYATPDTPGYADGEKTTTINKIIEGMYNLAPLS